MNLARLLVSLAVHLGQRVPRYALCLTIDLCVHGNKKPNGGRHWSDTRRSLCRW